MYRLILLLCCIVMLVSGCKQAVDKITHEKDYIHFISETGSKSKKLAETDTEICFWKNRLQENKEDLAAKTKLASLFSGRFDLSGNIAELHSADSLYRLVNEVNRFSSSSTYRSLAHISIKRHEFLRAKRYLDSALAMGDDRYQTMLSVFDVQMELGQTDGAEKTLNSLADKSNVQYLVRLSKLQDSKGDLEKAISILEKAAEKLNEKTEPSLYLWICSNLADMYGHANRFEDAYFLYLQVLQQDPEYYHCLKGIAWLAFSYDKRTDEAKKILQYLKKKHPVPDYDLLLAEIAAYENKVNDQQQYISTFLQIVTTPSYGNMYNKYICNIEADILKENNKAIGIAQTEVNNRPTTESFALLAWAYYRRNDISECLEIAKQQLEDKSVEPDILYKLGVIWHKAGDRKKARHYLELAYESSFELGPSKTNEIQELLETL